MNLSKRRHTLAEISPNKMETASKRTREYVSPKKCAVSIDFDQENFDFLLEEDNDWNFGDKLPDSSVSDENMTEPRESLNLESWQRCLVDSFERDHNFDLILRLSKENSGNEKLKCRLQGIWPQTKIEIGDLISIKANWSEKFKCFVVDNNQGMIVTNPDYLISGTTVVGSLYCMRKAVLQEKFRGIDADNKVMTIGSIVHELFQTVIRRKLTKPAEIKAVSDELLNSESMIFTLYSCKMSANDVRVELEPFISNITDFVEKYIEGKRKPQTNADQFAGLIDSIHDIEENVWVPQLGVKGKIDVSLKAKERTKSTATRCMPLELKTGRASFSNEHQGQIILYKMMLNEIGQKVDSGLLLYLRTGIMKEIHASLSTQRDIIMLRNELSYFLTRPAATAADGTVLYKTAILPEPINNYHACSKCPYSTICCTNLSETTKLSEKHPLHGISNECLAHLRPSDIEYFTHWCGLLALEDRDLKATNHSKNLWIKSPDQRRDEGQAIVDLKCTNVESAENRFLHRFEAATTDSFCLAANCKDFTLSGINVGDYVIVSTRERISIAAGHVCDLSDSIISIYLERNLTDNYKNDLFVVDKHVSQSTNIFNYTNLGVLLEDRDESNKLRKIIVDRMKPTFLSTIEKLPKSGQAIVADLNFEQKRVVTKALKLSDYMLIKGLPGTGKTQTLVAIIRLLELMGKSVLITSHTHSAIDNVLQRLKPHNVRFLRLGSNSRIAASLHYCSETQLTSACKSPEDLARVYDSYKIVGVTCLGAAHSIFLRRRFDYCIVDEATQVFQATVLRPLFYADRFILVGDPDQLPPIVKSKLGRKIGADESLFHRLDQPEATMVLSTQYRMNKVITRLANGLTYQGKLTCANDTVMNRTIDLPARAKLMESFRGKVWLLRTLEKHVDLSVCLLDTKNCLQRTLEFEKSLALGLTEVIEKTFADEIDSMRRFIYTNYCDAAVCWYIVKAILIGGCASENIGIIAPYRAQVELLRKVFEKCRNFEDNVDLDFSRLEVNTVDQYQGRDKQIIIYSCTRTGSFETIKDNVRSTELLEDRRRLTVAITRAKCKLIIVGDEQCLKGYTPFKDLLETIPARCKMTLEDGTMGFQWSEVFDGLRSMLMIK